MNNPSKPSPEQRRREAFDAELFAARQEHAAGLHQVLADAVRRNLDATMEAVGYADAYKVDEQDVLRLAVLASYRETQLALFEFTRDLLDGGGEGGRPASALPFSGASPSSSRPETPSSPGLPAGAAGVPGAAPKRGRGRPRKDKSLPGPGTNGRPQ